MSWLKEFRVGQLFVLFMQCAVCAQASTIYCSGTISKVYVDSSGSVFFYANWRSDYFEACSLNGTFGSANTVTCSVWYSMLMNAYQNQKTIMVEYPSTSYSCATMPNYANGTPPSYIMDE